MLELQKIKLITYIYYKIKRDNNKIKHVNYKKYCIFEIYKNTCYSRTKFIRRENTSQKFNTNFNKFNIFVIYREYIYKQCSKETNYF